MWLFIDKYTVYSTAHFASDPGMFSCNQLCINGPDLHGLGHKKVLKTLRFCKFYVWDLMELLGEQSNNSLTNSTPHPPKKATVCLESAASKASFWFFDLALIMWLREAWDANAGKQSVKSSAVNDFPSLDWT